MWVGGGQDLTIDAPAVKSQYIDGCLDVVVSRLEALYRDSSMKEVVLRRSSNVFKACGSFMCTQTLRLWELWSIA